MNKQVENPAKKRRTKRKQESESNPVLPTEVFDVVLEHLDVSERLVCRAVCKYFKQVIDRIKIRSLAIAEGQDSTCELVLKAYSDDYDWAEAVDYKRFSDRFYFVSNDPVYESNTLISPDTAAGLRTLVKCFDLSELRRLFVVEVRNAKTHFNLINRLVRLEHLQISSVDLDCSLRLKLPNLRTLSIAQINRRTGLGISLSTPNLKHLETRKLTESRLLFEYPSSVTFVQIVDFDDDLYELENLEVLICPYADSLVWFDYDLDSDDEDYVNALQFRNLPKLKRVDCARMFPREARELFYRCQHYGVDFYFCGLKIGHLEQELGYILEKLGRKDSLKLLGMGHMFDAYDQLSDALYFCDGIRYFKHFDLYFPSRLPENFASKFYCVRNIYVARKIENVDYFVQFLKCFKNLKKVWLDSAFLPQEFYEKHSHLFGRVHEFHYRHDDISNPPFKIDLKFILNFRYLENFLTNQPIRMELIAEAFNTLNYLNSFRLENFSDFALNFKIDRTKNKFSVLCLDPRKGCPIHEFRSKAKMLKFVKEHFPFLSTN